jgi:uncharacterized membrane protein
LKVQTIQWSKEKGTDNTMAKRKRQTIQWPKEKDRQYNGQKKKTDNTMTKRKRQTICLSFSFGRCIVCLFLLVIVLSVFFF